MLVKCKNCESKLKISDEKITENGIKIKCPKCSSILFVKKPAASKEEIPTEEKLEAAPPPIEEELPTQEAPFEEEPPEEEIALKEEAPEEEPAGEFQAEEQAESDEITFKDTLSEEELEATAPPMQEVSYKEEAPAEEQGEESYNDTFASEFTPSQEIEETVGEEESAGEEEPASDNEFTLDMSSEEVSSGEGAGEEFQLASNFDFSGEEQSATENEGADSNAGLIGEVGPGEEYEAAPSASESEGGIPFQEEESIPIRGTGGEQPGPASAPKPDEIRKPMVDSPIRKPLPKKEITSYGVSTRRSVPVIIPIILLVLIAGAVYVAYKKVNVEPVEDKGELILYDEKGEFANNEKEGKVFIVTGKVKNGYQIDRSFIQVKGILYDKDDNELASKTVFAGNVPTELECKRLPIEELDKMLNKQTGEAFSNMNIVPEASVNFKIVFARIDQDSVSKFKVIGAGSQPIYK